MTKKAVVPDILHVVYQHLDPFHRSRTLFNLLLVSRVFYSVFRPYLYKDLVVRNTNPRIGRLIKTLQNNESLLENVTSFVVHLDPNPNPPSLLQRIFKFTPPDDFHRLVRLLVDKPPKGLYRLTFFNPRPGSCHFTWTTLSQEVRDALLQLRCRSPPIRSLVFDYIGQVDPRMLQGEDGGASLEELYACLLHKPLDNGDLQPPISPMALRTLSLHSTLYFPLPVAMGILRRLEILHVDRPPTAFENLVGTKYTLIDTSKDTLKELYLQVVPQPPEPVIDYMCRGAGLPRCAPRFQRTLRLDLKGHTRLEALVISTDTFPLPPRSQTLNGSSFTLETKALAECLRSIDLPPFLASLHVRIHVDGSGIDVGEADQPSRDEVSGFRKDCQTLGECMVEMVRNGGVYVQRIKLSFIPTWSFSLTGNQFSGLKNLFVGLVTEMGERFEVYLGDEYRLYSSRTLLSCSKFVSTVRRTVTLRAMCWQTWIWSFLALRE